MKTYMAKKGEVQAKWHLVDAADKVVGRVAVRAAEILMGKHRPEYTPHVDTGDFIVIINADKVRVSGANKASQRIYERFSGYPSGRKVQTMNEVLATKPEQVLRDAIRRMLPKNKLGKAMLTKLKVYAGAEHPHQAQQPQALEV
jgi:large subunit ribosomal protein L13